MSEKEDLLEEAKEAFSTSEEAEHENRENAEFDIRFARMGEQWPAEIVKQREEEGRPVLTLNNLNTFIRQVTNDARLNKPAIKVFPADSNADKETAEVLNGLIRNIEYTSNAGVAYQTGLEYAVSGGFGYWRVDVDYSFDDSFDLDLQINRISNPFTVYGDPMSDAADSSDWNTCFVTDYLTESDFEKQFGKKEKVDWEGGAYGDLKGTHWRDKDLVMVAEWWKREEVDKKLFLLSDGAVVDQESLESGDISVLLQTGGLQVTRERDGKGHKVKRYLLSGAEILSEEDWVGKYIPIIPVYGDEVNIEGKRHFRSLIRDAKDAMRERNYWRSAQTELVALAPKTPWVAEEGSLVRAEQWKSSNRHSYGVLEYKKGRNQPTRTPTDGGPAIGAMQNAAMANDDLKAIIGLYDASLGAKSNEVSGKAIAARSRQGDVATYHFIDNLSRAIRHTGRVLVDLIPHVYSESRIARVIGEDGRERPVPINQQFDAEDDDGNVVTKIHDLTAGKYDLIVKTGPSFTSQRAEAAEQMMLLVQQFPAAAPIIGGLIAKNLDWPGADELADRIEAMVPPEIKQGEKGIPPQLQQLIELGKQQIAELSEENRQLKTDKSIEVEKVKIEQYKAETERARAEIERERAHIQGLEAAGKAEPNQIDVAETRIKQAEAKIKEFEAKIKEYDAETRRMAVDSKVREQDTNTKVNTAPVQVAQILKEAIDGMNKPKRAVKNADGDWSVIQDN